MKSRWIKYINIRRWDDIKGRVIRHLIENYDKFDRASVESTMNIISAATSRKVLCQ